MPRYIFRSRRTWRLSSHLELSSRTPSPPPYPPSKLRTRLTLTTQLRGACASRYADSSRSSKLLPPQQNCYLLSEMMSESWSRSWASWSVNCATLPTPSPNCACKHSNFAACGDFVIFDYAACYFNFFGIMMLCIVYDSPFFLLVRGLTHMKSDVAEFQSHLRKHQLRQAESTKLQEWEDILRKRKQQMPVCFQ